MKKTALLLIDVINDMDFPQSGSLLRTASLAAKRIAALKRRMVAAGVPVIYVNDNYGQWQSSFNDQIRRCLAADCPGRAVASQLIPTPEDYFILKPMHSGFYATALEVLLGHLGVEKLILTGFAADICVLYTANDAYMRGYELIVPSDCVAAETAALKATTLRHMKDRLKARVCQSRSIKT